MGEALFSFLHIISQNLALCHQPFVFLSAHSMFCACLLSSSFSNATKRFSEIVGFTILPFLLIVLYSSFEAQGYIVSECFHKRHQNFKLMNYLLRSVEKRQIILSNS